MAVTASTPIGVGDVVALKSGGPSMTVEGLENPPAGPAGSPVALPMIRCIWMTAAGQMDSRAFHGHSLVKIGDSGKPITAAEAAAADEKARKEAADNLARQQKEDEARKAASA